MKTGREGGKAAANKVRQEMRWDLWDGWGAGTRPGHVQFIHRFRNPNPNQLHQICSSPRYKLNVSRRSEVWVTRVTHSFVLSSCGVILWIAKVTHILPRSNTLCFLFVMLSPLLLSISVSLLTSLLYFNHFPFIFHLFSFLRDSAPAGVTLQKNTTSTLRCRSVLLKKMLTNLKGMIHLNAFSHHGSQSNIKEWGTTNGDIWD